MKNQLGLRNDHETTKKSYFGSWIRRLIVYNQVAPVAEAADDGMSW